MGSLFFGSGGLQLRIENEPKFLAAEALRMSSTSDSQTQASTNGSTELPNIHQLSNGQKKLERLSSNGHDHIVPDLATRQYLVVMRHGERADEVRTATEARVCAVWRTGKWQ
jgi:uncharacterized protein YggE